MLHKLGKKIIQKASVPLNSFKAADIAQASSDNLPKHLPLRSADLPPPRMRRVGKPVKADAGEVAGNPRARSAVMRVAEKLDGQPERAVA